jgi:hypothetical protein
LRVRLTRADLAPDTPPDTLHGRPRWPAADAALRPRATTTTDRGTPVVLAPTPVAASVPQAPRPASSLRQNLAAHSLTPRAHSRRQRQVRRRVRSGGWTRTNRPDRCRAPPPLSAAQGLHASYAPQIA